MAAVLKGRKQQDTHENGWYRQTSNTVYVEREEAVKFNVLGKDNCKTRRESYKFCYLMQLTSEILWSLFRLVHLSEPNDFHNINDLTIYNCTLHLKYWNVTLD